MRDLMTFALLMSYDGRTLEFWVSYYRKAFCLEYLLGTYRKPIIAIIDGSVMGGGVVISIPSTLLRKRFSQCLKRYARLEVFNWRRHMSSRYNLGHDKSGEAMKKHGRTGRGPIYAKASSSLNMEKLDDATSVKPLKSNRPGSEKNGSKMAHRVKKIMDRKWISRLCNLQNNGSESTGHTCMLLSESRIKLQTIPEMLAGDGCKSKKEAEQLVACVVISKLFRALQSWYTNRSSNSGNDSSCSCGDLTACSRITGLIGSMESPRQGIRIATCESNFKKKMKSEKQEKGQYKMRLEAQMSGQPCS
ncbi:hypothetical protein Tco_0256708 [Tanacetum coccineum]